MTYQRFVRPDGGSQELQLAHLVLENEEQRRVDLIGLIHIAMPEFYEGIRTFLEQHPNAAILGEGVKRSQDTDVTTLPVREQSFHLAMQMFLDLYPTVANQYGLSQQRELLPPQASWKSADVHSLEFIKWIASSDFPTPTKKFFQELRRIASLMEEKAQTPVPREVFIARSMRMHKIWWLLDRLPIVKKLTRVVVTDRSQRALEVFEQQEADHVIFVWGVGHHDDFVRYFTKQGYRITQVIWRTAVSA